MSLEKMKQAKMLFEDDNQDYLKESEVNKGFMKKLQNCKKDFNDEIKIKEENKMKTQRIEEIMTEMKSFRKENYHKSELLNEMFALQQEVVELTFSGDHAATAELRIWDVERHLEQLNEDCGNVADEELARFKEGCKVLCNLIKAEISGNRGEYKAFKTLEYLRLQNRILRNVELSDGDIRTELDAVVITPKCLTIVEVKNTSKNIFIDEDGNYYKTGEFLKWDSNIAEKMSVKEGLLKKILEAAGYGHVQIRSIVVFTNNRIEVQNKYRQIRTSFVSQLAYIIDGYRLDDTISIDEMDKLQQIIQEAECKEAYPFKFDVNQYKTDFANLMATLEFAKTQEEVEEEVVVENIKPAKKSEKTTLSSIMRSIFASKQFKYVGSTAAALVVSVASGIIAANTISKGGF